MLKQYYELTKPGIIYGNAMTATAGFLLAEKGHFNIALFLATIVGLSLVIASGCVFNNYLDRYIDGRMQRTKDRPMVLKLLPVKTVLTYGSILGLLGAAVLFFFTNLLTAGIAAGGFFFYVFVYTPLKRRTIHSTLLGGIAGAVPPVVGYCAVTNHFDLAALLLFLILMLWQLPHFYSIAIYRLKDYTAASIPILPVKKGVLVTKIQMVVYIIFFTLAAVMLSVLHYTGTTYLIIAALLGLTWLGFSLKGFTTKNETAWARKMFFISLIVLTLLSLTISLTVVLP